MHHPSPKPSEHLGRIDFDIHGVVGIRLINPSPDDLAAACKLLGQPSSVPLIKPDITVRFVEDLPTREIRLLGADKGFTDDGFFVLREGTRQVNARIPFDCIGGPCEIICKSHIGSVPLLLPIAGLTALKKDCVPLHASAVVYNNVGIMMAGWPHCGKTAALLGFASKGAEFVGEECVLLRGNGQSMYGLLRPLEISHSHVASLPHVRNALSIRNRFAFHGVGILRNLQKMIFNQRIRNGVVFGSLGRVSAALEGRLRPAIPPSAIFQARIHCHGVTPDKILLFVTHDDPRVDVEPISPFEMACRLSFLVQQELAPLLRHYVAYRFAFPSQRNVLIENAVDYSFENLVRALDEKETYIVRLPYPHMFPELFEAIQPYCRPPIVSAVKTLQALA